MSVPTDRVRVPSMTQICRRCKRLNPREAAFCYFDGHLLDDGGGNGASVNFAARPFTAPFPFPSGPTCRNFAELARACYDRPAAALELLRNGVLESFLRSQGRLDLAVAAREAARSPDRDRGLDDFLGKLPGDVLKPARLRVEPQEIDLGVLRIGEDRRLELRLYNDGERLLHGTALSEAGWLGLGDNVRARQKLFQLSRTAALVVHVRGGSLRAYPQPQTAAITFESNGGTATVQVTVEVPVKPFPEGVLAGVTTPRQLAERAKAAPREAAFLIESGRVARWYEDNGWKYPVRGPTAAGVGAVQQLFEALGLVTPPKVDISARELHLEAMPGARVEQKLAVFTEEKRAVVAWATCDEPWLLVGRTLFNARTATIPLIVPSVPYEPGATLRCTVTVYANGNQRFAVPVFLAIRGTPETYVPEPIGAADTYVPLAAGAETYPAWAAAAEVGTEPVSPVAVAAPAPSPLPLSPEGRGVLSSPLAPWGRGVGGEGARPSRRARLAPLAVLGLSLLLAAVHDLFVGGGERLLDREPRLEIQAHEKGDNAIPEATMRFGLVLPAEGDSREPKKIRKLTRDAFGRTNNTCVRLDGAEYFFGAGGRWDPQAEETGSGTQRGVRSSWLPAGKRVRFTQEVALIPGPQSRLLDTCLVRYRIANEDAAPHKVGLRFLLDTFLGSRGGGPFAVPGDSRLCDDRRELEGAAVPDFLEALEKDDLRHPGAVVHLGLRLGRQVEAPSRVTLGAWPDRRLQDTPGGERARGHNTGWDVPLLPMSLLDPPDAAATLYWDEKELKPGEVREVGFTCGLGSLASGEGRGELALSAGGSFAAGGEFTVLAYVRNPAAGQALTLQLPDGLALAASSRARQEVPAGGPGVLPVAWRVKSAGRDGRYDVKVASSTGVSQGQTLFIRNRRFLD